MSEQQPPIRRFDVEIIDEAPKPRLGTPVGQDPDFMHNVYKHHDHGQDHTHGHEHGNIQKKAADTAETRPASSADFLEHFVAGQDLTAQEESASEDQLIDNLVAALRDIYDPELPVNIYDLGLIYDVKTNDGHVDVIMTLTTPHCPVAESMPGEVEMRILAVPGVATCHVELVWDPPWNPDNMTDEAKLELGML